MAGTGELNLQGAADAAALSAVVSAAAGDPTARIKQEAKSVILASTGYVNTPNVPSITVNNPPATGGYTSNNAAWEVIVSQVQPMFFASSFIGGAPTSTSRAVAVMSSTPACLMSLAPSGSGAMSMTGGANFNLTNCNLYVNSTALDGLTFSNGASLTAAAVYLAGGYTAGAGSTLTPSSGANYHADTTPAADPYAGRTMPSYSGCNQTNYITPSSGPVTLPTSGTGVTVYCGWMGLNTNVAVTIPAGIYIIDGGSFIMGNSVTVSGTGVTIILTSHTGSAYGSINIAGGTSLTLTAPTSGATAGIVFWVDKNAPSSTVNAFSNGSSMNLTGAVYAPSSQITDAGGFSVSNCTQLIAYTFNISNGATLSHNCSGTGVSDPTGGKATKPVE